MRLLSARSGVRIPPRTPFYLYVPETVRKSGRFFFVLSCHAGDRVQLFVSRQTDYTQERIPPRTPFYLYVPETVRKSGRFFFVLSCHAGDRVQLFVSRQTDYTQESRLRHAGMDKEPARKRTGPAHAENPVLFCGKQPVCIRRQPIPFSVSGQFDPMQISVSLS